MRPKSEIDAILELIDKKLEYEAEIGHLVMRGTITVEEALRELEAGPIPPDEAA